MKAFLLLCFVSVTAVVAGCASPPKKALDAFPHTQGEQKSDKADPAPHDTGSGAKVKF